MASLKRLNHTIINRRKVINKIARKLSKFSVVCRGYDFNNGYSPYYYPIWVNWNKLDVLRKILQKQ